MPPTSSLATRARGVISGAGRGLTEMSRTLYGELRRQLGPVYRRLTEPKENRVEKGHLMPDDVHTDDRRQEQLRLL